MNDFGHVMNLKGNHPTIKNVLRGYFEFLIVLLDQELNDHLQLNNKGIIVQRKILQEYFEFLMVLIDQQLNDHLQLNNKGIILQEKMFSRNILNFLLG